MVITDQEPDEPFNPDDDVRGARAARRPREPSWRARVCPLSVLRLLLASRAGRVRGDDVLLRGRRRAGAAHAKVAAAHARGADTAWWPCACRPCRSRWMRSKPRAGLRRWWMTMRTTTKTTRMSRMHAPEAWRRDDNTVVGLPCGNSGVGLLGIGGARRSQEMAPRLTTFAYRCARAARGLRTRLVTSNLSAVSRRGHHSRGDARSKRELCALLTGRRRVGAARTLQLLVLVLRGALWRCLRLSLPLVCVPGARLPPCVVWSSAHPAPLQ